MCLPMALPMVFQAAGALVQGGSALLGGMSQAKSMKEAARVSEANARLALAKGSVEENRIIDQSERVYGAQMAHFTDANLDPSFGSPLLVMANSAAQANVDRQLVRAGAQMEAANNYEQSASLRKRASQARMAGIVGMATAMLQAGGKMFGGSEMGGASKAAGSPLMLAGASSSGNEGVNFTNPGGWW